jgi:rod shape-determining protein MreC
VRDLLIRYRRTVVLALALALPLASMYHHGKVRAETSFIERTLLAVTAPIQDVTGAGLRWGLGIIDGYILLTRVRQRNRELVKENQVLLGEALRSRQLAEELSRVKQLCTFRKSAKRLSTVPARVIGREVSQFFRVARIKLDTAGVVGLREGLAVITHNGVVGRIDKVAGGYADVMLITDSRSQIHATVAGKGVIGTVRGQGKRNEFAVRFVFLERAERRSAIVDGDAVLTTGHDRVFPPGLEIGHITAGKTTQHGSYHQHTLTPAVALATLEEVLVVIDHHAPKRKTPIPQAARSRRLRVDPANTPDG